MDGLVYTTGQPVCLGDVVRVGDQRAVITSLFTKYTLDAKAFACFETGGVFLTFDNGDRQLWPWVNEDLEFIERKNSNS